MINFKINNCLDDEDFIRRKLYIKNAAYNISLLYVGDYAQDVETNSIDPDKISCDCTRLQINRFNIIVSNGIAAYELDSWPMIVRSNLFDNIRNGITIAEETVTKLNELIEEHFLKYASKDALD